MTGPLKAGHYRAGTRMADGRRVTGKCPYMLNGQPHVRLTFDDGSMFYGRTDRAVTGGPVRAPGTVAVMSGPTRGGRSIPTQALFAAIAPLRRKRVGTVDGYERLLERMSY